MFQKRTDINSCTKSKATRNIKHLDQASDTKHQGHKKCTQSRQQHKSGAPRPKDRTSKGSSVCIDLRVLRLQSNAAANELFAAHHPTVRGGGLRSGPVIPSTRYRTTRHTTRSTPTKARRDAPCESTATRFAALPAGPESTNATTRRRGPCHIQCCCCSVDACVWDRARHFKPGRVTQGIFLLTSHLVPGFGSGSDSENSASFDRAYTSK